MKTLRAFGLGVVGTTLVGTALVIAVPTIGDERSGRQQLSSGHHRAPATVTVSAKKRSSGTIVQDLSYEGTVPPGKEDGYEFKCPKKTPHAMSGFFVPGSADAAGKIQLADSFPLGKGNSKWDIGVFNPTTEPQKYFVGVVCIK